MPQNVCTRYQPRSHRYLTEINVNTKNLYQIPTKPTNVITKTLKGKICSIIFAAVTVTCVSLAITLPFIINLNKNKSNTTTAASNASVVTGSSVSTVTNIIIAAATTVSVTSVTSTDTTTSTTTTDTTSSTTSVTTRTTTQDPYACSNMTILVGYDLSGSDLTFQYTANYTLCCEFCLSNSSCVAFTWIVATSNSPCYLKLAVPPHTVNSALISAHY